MNLWPSKAENIALSMRHSLPLWTQRSNIGPMRDKKRWCPLFGKCGGCDYVNETYDYELMMKWLREDKLLGRYGRVEKVLSSPSLTGYRCKVQAVCGRDRDGKFITGQYRKGSHHLFPIRSCSLEDGMATAVLQTVRQMATRFSISPFDEDRGTGDLRHILIRITDNIINYIFIYF